MKQLESYKEKCRKNPSYIPLTVGDEIDKAIEEWYSSRNLSIPADEVGVGLKLDQENYERLQSQLGIVEEAEVKGGIELVPEVVVHKAPEPTQAGEKPPFGTPEFWKWAHKRKLEKEAETVQKEAEKAKKALEKEVEKAKKEANKELEKARKLAEKEAEKARKAAEKAVEKEAEKARKEAEKAAKKIVAKSKDKK